MNIVIETECGTNKIPYVTLLKVFSCCTLKAYAYLNPCTGEKTAVVITFSHEPLNWNDHLRFSSRSVLLIFCLFITGKTCVLNPPDLFPVLWQFNQWSLYYVLFISIQIWLGLKHFQYWSGQTSFKKFPFVLMLAIAVTNLFRMACHSSVNGLSLEMCTSRACFHTAFLRMEGRFP